MADMITVDEIEILYGQTLTDDEIAEVELYIDMAIGEIEAWLGRPVTLTAVVDEEVLPNSSGTCYFKVTPVAGPSVTALTVNGEVISDIGDWITVTPYGLDNLWEQTLASPIVNSTNIDRVGYYGAEVVVSYTGGLDFPNAVKSLVTFGVLNKFIKSAANRIRTAGGQQGLKRIEVEDYVVEYERPLASSRSSGTSSILIFESETDFWPIRRYKRRSIT